jgi:UDP-N-acetylglucosamine 4,6-dehydratase
MRLLITGGSGALGQALVRGARTWPEVERIAIYSRDEHKQQKLAQALGNDPKDRIRYFIGDVRDVRRLEMAMSGMTHVVHAAALKIVPWLEYNPDEGIKTNVGGAANVVDAAIRCGVSRVVGISTDKAVAPVNLYGATKLASEKLFLAANALGGGRTSFSVARYGNVTGSTGSIVPLWRPFAATDQALPLTDDGMSRFWISLPEAVEVVRRMLFDGRGGEIYIPKLPSYYVKDLGAAVWAEQNPTSSLVCRFKAIGIRPGEKLHESMINEDEARWTYDCGDHYEIVQTSLAGGPGGHVEDVGSTISGTKVPEDFRYKSNENEQWLTVEQMIEKLKSIK